MGAAGVGDAGRCVAGDATVTDATPPPGSCSDRGAAVSLSLAHGLYHVTRNVRGGQGLHQPALKRCWRYWTFFGHLDTPFLHTVQNSHSSYTHYLYHTMHITIKMYVL